MLRVSTALVTHWQSVWALHSQLLWWRVTTCSRPEADKIKACETCEGEDEDCYFAGDFRVNEQPMLTVQHNVWVREHNRVARDLRKISPGLEAETVFQQARRIVIAEWQHIVYSEWLPIVLGVGYTSTFQLLPLTEGYSQDYDPDFDPRINNEFATAAFRFGHTLGESLINAKILV